MEENFPLTWEDATTVVQGEEVICDIENEILPGETAEFTGVCEEVVISQDSQNVQSMDGNQIMYITDDNVIVMEGEDEVQHTYQDNFIDCDVSEEIVTEQWGDGCPEEIIIGSEEAVGGTETGEDVEIPLPTDQDEYTAARPYPCDFCSRRFRKKVNLMNHMVMHQTDRPHGCNLCGTRYVRKCDLMNHLKIHAYIPETEGLDEDSLHPMEETDADRLKRKMKPFGRRRKKKVKEELETFESSPSGSRIYNYISEDMRLVDTADTKQEYVQYLSDNGGSVVTRYPITDPKKPFVCQHCGVGFAREKALASHARVHGGDSSFDCQKCGEMFWDVTSMREHLRMKHGETEELEDEEEDEYSEEDARFGTFYCPTCGICFHRQDLLKRHQKVHIKNENEFMTERDFGHSGHICNVCGDSFQEALDLLAHAEVHARTLEYRCLVCGEVSPDEQGVAAHVQTKHGKNLPPNTCMLCGRTCKDRRTLLKHSWEHSKEKQFACSKCAKTFHNKARLKRHMLSHRSKAVTCETCGEEFPDGRTLMNHRHSHSSVSGKQFPCKECGKTFGSRSSQQIHIRIHTGERPYGCRFCWKAFADGGTLRKHERIHTGEKPYACAVCPRAFNQRVVLREHIRSHHSAPDPNFAHTMTPYCCAVCSDMFSTSQDLIIHLIHHCDLNTAMRRQPPVGPRKYKRRRKLKPHELELISSRLESEVMEDPLPQIESEIEEPEPPVSPVKKVVRRPKKSVQKTAAVTTTAVAAATTTTTTPPSTTSTSASDPYTDLYNSCSSAIENINSIVNSKPGPKSKKKGKGGDGQVTSRPKMIHTQKTRVPVETGEDGRVRHRTKTIVSRTQPTELKPTSSERIRPRTKNVSYHIYNSEKIPMATFPENDAAQAVNSLMKSEVEYEINGLSYMESTDHPPEIASEQIVETEMPSPIKTKPGRKSRRAANNKKTGIAGKVVRIVKGGMIVAKKKKNGNEFESQAAMSDNYGDQLQVDMGEEVNEPEMESEIVIEETRLHDPQNMVVIKQEMVDIVEQSPLHELAEISMQHAQSIFKCDMCSAVFGDRAQLLLHVPIHI